MTPRGRKELILALVLMVVLFLVVVKLTPDTTESGWVIDDIDCPVERTIVDPDHQRFVLLGTNCEVKVRRIRW